MVTTITTYKTALATVLIYAKQDKSPLSLCVKICTTGSNRTHPSTCKYTL